MAKNNITLTYRVGQIEKQVEHLIVKVDKIRTNDVPHLHEELATLKVRMGVLSMVNVGAVIIGVLIAKYL